MPGGISASVGSSSRPALGVARTRSFFARANHFFLNSHTIAWVAEGSAFRKARSLRTTVMVARVPTHSLNTARELVSSRKAPIGQFSQSK